MLQEYAQNIFPIDVQRLVKERCNPIASEMLTEPDAVFWGGSEWSNFSTDIREVTVENRSYFCLCLFLMTCCDQHIYANHHNRYAEFRRHFRYPKFGWCGFGPHYEKPRFILRKAVAEGVNFGDIDGAILMPFLSAQFEIIRNIFGPDFACIFFQTILNDRDFISEAPIFTELKNSIELLIEHNCRSNK